MKSARASTSATAQALAEFGRFGLIALDRRFGLVHANGVGAGLLGAASGDDLLERWPHLRQQLALPSPDELAGGAHWQGTAILAPDTRTPLRLALLPCTEGPVRHLLLVADGRVPALDPSRMVASQLRAFTHLTSAWIEEASTPLNTMKLAHALLEQRTGERASGEDAARAWQRYRNVIADETGRLANVLSGWRALANHDGDPDERFDLGAASAEVVRLLRQEAVVRRTRLDFSRDERPVIVRGDRTLVQLVAASMVEAFLTDGSGIPGSSVRVNVTKDADMSSVLEIVAESPGHGAGPRAGDGGDAESTLPLGVTAARLLLEAQGARTDFHAEPERAAVRVRAIFPRP